MKKLTDKLLHIMLVRTGLDGMSRVRPSSSIGDSVLDSLDSREVSQSGIVILMRTLSNLSECTFGNSKVERGESKLNRRQEHLRVRHAWADELLVDKTKSVVPRDLCTLDRDRS